MASRGMARVRKLRAQVEALTVFRDAMARAMGCDEYDALSQLMIPTTDRILHELAREEQGDAYVPYPHPIGEAWWDDFEIFAAAAQGEEE